MLGVKITLNISNQIHVTNTVGRVSDISIFNGDEIKLGKSLGTVALILKKYITFTERGISQSRH